MRIAAVADLHFTPQSYDRIREPLSRARDEADVLVLAGDLTNYGKREEMESLFGIRMFLDLHVKVESRWRENPAARAEENELAGQGWPNG